jgi:hypothetical protein
MSAVGPTPGQSSPDDVDDARSQHGRTRHAAHVVVGKGNRPRVLPIGAKTVRALDTYLRARRTHAHAASPALWLGRRGALEPTAPRDMSQPRPRLRRIPVASRESRTRLYQARPPADRARRGTLNRPLSAPEEVPCATSPTRS